MQCQHNPNFGLCTKTLTLSVSLGGGGGGGGGGGVVAGERIINQVIKSEYGHGSLAVPMQLGNICAVLYYIE